MKVDRAGLFQPEVPLHGIHQPRAEFLATAMHRQNRLLAAESHNQVATMPRLKRAALLL
jgi:hypothetical protein